MKLKLKTIAIMPFAQIITVIQIITGFILGLVVTVVSIVAPNEQAAGGVGAWSILVFPVLNGLIGFSTALFVAWAYNKLAPKVGGAVFEFENIA